MRAEPAAAAAPDARADGRPPLPDPLLPWPSVFFALDLLAWDVFLGLSLVLAASVFRGGGPQRRIRIALAAAGTLCLMGTLGPLLGELRLQVVAILGHAFVFPVACLVLGLLFRRTASAADGVVVSAPLP